MPTGGIVYIFELGVASAAIQIKYKSHIQNPYNALVLLLSEDSRSSIHKSIVPNLPEFINSTLNRGGMY